MHSLSPWRVTSSNYVRKDAWIALREDHCVTAEGVQVGPYYVLEYTDWVQLVVLGADDRLLLVEQYRHGAAMVTLELPAGKIDPEDADPVAAAVREPAEETGCAGDSVEVLQTSPVNPASHTNRVHSVLVRGARRTGPPKFDPSENIRTCWMTPGEVLQAAFDGRLPALQAASVLSAFNTLGWLSFALPRSIWKERSAMRYRRRAARRASNP